MTSFLLAFAASFAFIFLKAFQQLNVVHGQYLLVFPTSILMSACEVAVIAIVARQGWGWIILFTGSGAGFGCIAAMMVHKLTRGHNASY